MQSVNSIKTYVYETCKDLVSKKKEIKFNNIISQYKNIYFRLCCKGRRKRI